jgi:hypothetical protein
MNATRNLNSLRRLTFAAAALLGGGALTPVAAPAAADEWKFAVTPYIWATDVGIDVAVDDRQVVDAEIPIEELIQDVETIAQVRFEAQRGAHGLFADLFDVTLADDAAIFALPSGVGNAELRPEMGMTIFDLGGIYDPNGDQQGLQLLYGARLLNQRAEIDARFELADGSSPARTYEVDDTLADGLVGVRYIRQLGERWSLAARADVSTGGTELTWSANPSVGYSFGRNGRYTAFAGYRKMVVDFETAENVDAKMTLAGFYAGLRFAF